MALSLLASIQPVWDPSIAWRKGRVILKVESRRGLDTVEVACWVRRIIREEKTARVNIDVGGLGTGVYDRLYETASNRRIIQAGELRRQARRAAGGSR